jgi:methionyl-tRNA formyltransferase
MNIVFFGSSQFAVSSLRALLTSGHKITCVVTQPDRKSGRHLHLVATPVKIFAQDAGLRIYQPPSVNTKDAIKFLRDLNSDLCVVIAYGQILSEEVLNIPKIFAINVHASLLPKYRGAAPINWAIIKGEKSTGITIIKMTREMDAGPIILERPIDISNDDTEITLEDKLSKLGADALLESLKLIEENRYNLVTQDETKVIFAPKLKKEDGLIDWHKPAEEIYNLIRGCLGWPGGFSYYKGKLLKIYKAGVIPLSRYSVSPLPGEIIEVSKEGIVVVTGKGNLVIQELQIEGKRRMTAEEFVAGHKILAGEILKNSCI